MECSIVVKSNRITNEKLRELIENDVSWDKTIQLKFKKIDSNKHRVDSTILIAIITMSNAVLVAFITGLFRILHAIFKEKIVLVTKEGLRIEVESKNAKEKILELVKLIKSMEIQRFEL